jgi:mono/diheme cytochrome c family protein
VTNKRRILVVLCALSLASAVLAAAQETKPVPVSAAQEQQPTAVANAPDPETASQPAPAANAKPTPRSIEAAERIEGEKRFRANCGRCHQTPHKFPPRTMATVIRHMRVRAMITDDDMRLILRYMTQ